MSLDIYTDDKDDLYYENDSSITHVNILTSDEIKITFINCPNLKIINVSGEDNIIDLLVSKCSNLEHITIDSYCKPNSIIIKKGCNNLKIIHIYNTKYVDIEKQDFSNLDYIYFNNIESLTFDIEECHNLTSFIIKNCKINNIMAKSAK